LSFSETRYSHTSLVFSSLRLYTRRGHFLLLPSHIYCESNTILFPAIPVMHIPYVAPAVVPLNVVPPAVEPVTSPRKRPVRTPGLVGTNAAFLVPDHIRRKFVDGWTSHVPLTFLTDRGCLLKNKSLISAAQETLSFDSITGQVVATSKPLNDNGELDLTFDEWHQAWRRLLELIHSYFPEEFLMWETHYNFILNNQNRAEMWPLYLAYDTEIRKRSTVSSIDPSQFSIGIWNDLEIRYTAKKVYSLVQSELKQHSDRPTVNQNASSSRLPSQGSSFRNQQPLSDKPKTGRCIFCGDRSKNHMSRNCTAACCINGTPFHMVKSDPNSNTRQSRSGQRYCYAWNGPSGCDQGPCQRGEHLCTLCGTSNHNAQQCSVVA
jgi:hypothetical protein